MKIRFFILGLVLTVAPGFARPADSLVQRYFENLESLRADFIQTVFDENDRPLETSSGRMVMQRPGRFRWDYHQPFEQVVVADGKRLWHYDSALEQVSVRRLDTALSATPLALLSGAAPIEKVFTVERMVSRQGLQWFELQPKDPRAEFQALRVAFRGDVLESIELEDVFNQRTRLTFRGLERNVAVDPALLRFEPPPGVDVVGDVP